MSVKRLLPVLAALCALAGCAGPRIPTSVANLDRPMSDEPVVTDARRKAKGG